MTPGDLHAEHHAGRYRAVGRPGPAVDRSHIGKAHAPPAEADSRRRTRQEKERRGRLERPADDRTP